jgi:hypothetical protein
MAVKMLGADRNETGTIINFNRYICSVEPKKKIAILLALIT